VEQNVQTTIGSDHLALREQVLAELRRRIVDGDYAQGERLTENRLADDFGVSRNPVREALRVVETEGFVQILPRRGAVVATIDETAVRDLFAVRVQLETLAAGLAAERATEQDVARLRALLDQASAATEAKDFDRVAELNSALHLAVIEISGRCRSRPRCTTTCTGCSGWAHRSVRRIRGSSTSG
jgi:DNA-binding GntR family transcriptional regulator